VSAVITIEEWRRFATHTCIGTAFNSAVVTKGMHADL
jgi:hypothetical protein